MNSSKTLVVSCILALCATSVLAQSQERSGAEHERPGVILPTPGLPLASSPIPQARPLVIPTTDFLIAEDQPSRPPRRAVQPSRFMMPWVIGVY